MVEPHVATILDVPTASVSLTEARALCEQMARTRYENFTVTSWLIPRSMRSHVAALYAYCRTVDDIGDEAPGDRIELLDQYEAELERAFTGTPGHPVLVALQETIRRFDLPREPFARLIEANRIDQRVCRYANYEELLCYCVHSANPVGRLFLMLFGYRDEERFALSDATCTALQLTNFWQDIGRDRNAGRVYLPQDELAAFGVADEDLDADRASVELRRLVRFEVDRTRRLFSEGSRLIDSVRGRLRVDLSLFTRGGLAILDAIERQGHDTLVRRPTLGRSEKVGLLVSSLLSSRWRRKL